MQDLLVFKHLLVTSVYVVLSVLVFSFHRNDVSLEIYWFVLFLERPQILVKEFMQTDISSHCNFTNDLRGTDVLLRIDEMYFYFFVKQ